jgi:hypothetical protein
MSKKIPGRDERQSHLFGVQPKGPAKRMPEPTVVSGTGRFPDFIYHGGPVIKTPQVYILFVGDWSSAANQTRASRLSQFVSDFLNSSYMNILSQYGCGTTGNVANSVFVPAPDNSLSGTDIHSILQTAINNNRVAEPANPSYAYMLYLDDNIAVNDTADGIEMCESTNDNAFGFHLFFRTTAGNVCPFAVVPGLNNLCLTDSCPGNDAGCSLHLAETQEQRQTQVTSHELSEMFSDAQLNAWFSPTADENGDICNGQSGTISVGSNIWTVQLMYSKWDDMNTNGSTTCIAPPANPLPSLFLPSISSPVVSWAPNRLDIFGLGTVPTNSMYHKAWANGWFPSQTDWEPLGGVFNSPPAAVSWGPNRLDIFGLGTDNSMYHKYWANGWGPSQTDWEALGGGFNRL